MRYSLPAFKQHSEDGFTLLEILVVITITGVLAAIAMPVFLNQRKNAVDDMLRVDLKNIIKAADSVRANNPNARYLVYKDKRVCAGDITAPTTCPASSPVVKTESGGSFVVSNGVAGAGGGTYFAAAWHPDANKYTTQTTRLFYNSTTKAFTDCPACS